MISTLNTVISTYLHSLERDMEDKDSEYQERIAGLL